MLPFYGKMFAQDCSDHYTAGYLPLSATEVTNGSFKQYAKHKSIVFLISDVFLQNRRQLYVLVSAFSL